MICDLAETYHVLNYRGLSPDLVAVLVLGLRDDSRVKMFLSNTRINVEQTLLAIVCDNLNFQSWTHSKEANKGKAYKQRSILKALQGIEEENKNDLMSFRTIEEYEAYMNRFNT